MNTQDDDGTLYPYIPQAEGLEDSYFSVLMDALRGSFDGGSLWDLLSLSNIFGLFGDIWSIYTVFAYLFSILLLTLYVYATVRWNHFGELQSTMLRDAEALWDERYRGIGGQSRLRQVYDHGASERPNDWKLAIIEADIVLDEILKERGYTGNSLGERLRNLTPAQLSTIDDAWEAHKVRNRIAHDGADFVLTKRIADETIARYRRVFNEFGIT